MKSIKPQWKHKRIIHSHFPPINVFDTVNSEDEYLLALLEGETSDRLINWSERVSLEDARFGEGWGAVMGALCYSRAGRFNTDSFGAYYCANSEHTAIAEWSHHAGKTWAEFGWSKEVDATVRCYVGSFENSLIDVTDIEAVHNKTSYLESQILASELNNNKAQGIYYKSTRHEGGLAAALFRPTATSTVTQGKHFSVLWNGNQFTEYAQLNDYKPL